MTSPVQAALDCAGLTWRGFATASGLGQYTVTQFVQGQVDPSPRLVKALAVQLADPGARKALAEWLVQNEYAAKLDAAQREWISDKRGETDWVRVRYEYKEGGLRAAVRLYPSASAAAKAWCVHSGNLLRALKTGKIPSEVLELLA